MARLGEIFDLQMGKTPSRNKSNYWTDGQYSWVSIADLGTYQKYVGATKEEISEVAVRESGIKSVPANTVIMSFKLSLGKTAITKEEVYTNEAIMAFIPTGKYDVLPDYFYHLFTGKDWSKETNRAVMGATLNKAMLSEISVPVPLIDEQRKIAAVLDKVSDLIAKRRQQLDKLDELVKARFVEMFGTEQQKKALSDICCIITDGTHQPPKFISDGIPFLFVSNIVSNQITYETEKYISEETYNELIKRTPIELGDILLSTVGSYGHPAIVKEDRRFLFQRHIAYLKPKHDIVQSQYLHAALLSNIAQRQIESKVKGVAQKTLNLSEIRKIVLPVPPMDRQLYFCRYIEQTEKTKTTISKSLEKLETLKKALMQEYFG